MIPIQIEAIYFASQILVLFRTYNQYYASKKEQRSVNPLLFWVATILSNVLVGVYGFLIGSFIIPIMSIISLPISLWHLDLERKRKVKKE